MAHLVGRAADCAGRRLGAKRFAPIIDNSTSFLPSRRRAANVPAKLLTKTLAANCSRKSPSSALLARGDLLWRKVRKRCAAVCCVQTLFARVSLAKCRPVATLRKVTTFLVCGVSAAAANQSSGAAFCLRLSIMSLVQLSGSRERHDTFTAAAALLRRKPLSVRCFAAAATTWRRSASSCDGLSASAFAAPTALFLLPAVCPRLRAARIISETKLAAAAAELARR